MSDTLNWGIIGTGAIAGIFARGLAGSETGHLLAVGSRSQASADRFGQEFNAPRRYASYDALLADADVQAVYVATPHPMHAEWAAKTAEAGKHLLCEKPLAMNHAEAMAIVEAARRHDVFLMEAFMYRCHPQTARIVELIREGAIGEVRSIYASFSFHCPFNADSRLYNNALGGGGILDVGCYCTSFARLVAGAANGIDVAEPIEVHAVGHLGETGVDEYTTACLRFPGDIVASLTTGVAVTQDNCARIFGTKGHIHVPVPWIPANEGGTTRFHLHRADVNKTEEIVITTERGLYSLEADTIARHADRREAPSPAMTWADSLGNMKTLDRWREAIGLVYESERFDAPNPTVHRRPLARRDDTCMAYGEIEGVGQPVSRLIMGVDNQRAMPHASVMFDDFFERGGSAFDTAHIYMGGESERILGQWMRNRGIREKVVVIDKGAHAPWCDPVSLDAQFKESLDRLQTDYVDVYLMHRDNPDVPVGEFVDVMAAHRDAGRMRAFGVSNWTLERVEQANQYAQSKRIAGLAVVSNQFSLARMVEPPWPGCISCGDSEGRAWFERTGMPLLAWSSQGRGFFTGRASREDTSDAELVRCWYADDNFNRLERVREMAERRGVPMIVIALAWVLHQPFPTFALIGPRTIEETRVSCGALDVELSADELAWLNLEA